ncbi:hypothetical protein VIGAN_06176900 [Vigna angularis var. angularis]|uniref:Uncharacterized protein n=1 Tax=Vigna angularis var. angularis TaxID=157739 RepID=A0A0S3SCK9_PHAAN|nr:hypothetical protein VIGAN_06176900 [Vigna angularis var. angularis]
MVLFILPRTCLLHGMITAGIRHQILYSWTNQLGQVLVTLLIRVTFVTMKPALAMIYMTSCRRFSRLIQSLLRMSSISLENHTLDTIFLHLHHGLTKTIK